MTDPKPGSELATFDPNKSSFPVLFAEAGDGSVAQVLEDNFGDEGFRVSDLDRIKIPAGGGTFWEIPDEDPAKVVEGVIVHKQATRSFWFKKRGEDGEDDGPPDCYSVDAKVGNGAFGPESESNPSGLCKGCPMDEFGSSTSGSGEGKACKEQMQVFLLQEGAVLPIQVSLPPTSLKNWRQYMTRLASKGKSFMTVVTGFGLVVTKGGGQTYSVAEPKRVRDLEPAEGQAARAYGATIRGVLEQAAAEFAAGQTQAQYEGNDSAGGDVKPGGDVWRSDEPAAEEPAKG